MSALRLLAARWSLDMAAGRRSDDFYPGGAYVAALLAAQRAVVIE